MFNNYYVEIKHEGGALFPMASCKCVPSGKTRNQGSRIEAEFFCINPECPEREIWATQDQLITELTPTEEIDSLF